MVDITGSVQKELSKAGADDGVCVVYVPHTTAGVTINEGADPAVVEQLGDAVEGGRLVKSVAAIVIGDDPGHFLNVHGVSGAGGSSAEDRQTFADPATDVFLGDGGEAERLQADIDRIGDVGQRVGKGAVEIENDAWHAHPRAHSETAIINAGRGL